MTREVGDYEGRQEATGRAHKVDQRVDAAREIRRQVLSVLQIRQRGGAVEAETQRDYGHTPVRAVPDEAQAQQQQPGQNVRCNAREPISRSVLTHSVPPTHLQKTQNTFRIWVTLSRPLCRSESPMLPKTKAEMSLAR